MRGPTLPADPAAGSLNSSALTHRYRLLAQKPASFAGGTMRVVSEREFPISATETGAILHIEPRGLREPHWHPNPAEWQYYTGRARMTVFGSHGRACTDEFGPGDVGADRTSCTWLDLLAQARSRIVMPTQDLPVRRRLGWRCLHSRSVEAWECFG